ncbi:type I restriction endonuclease subunit R [Halorussus amylolyticus]|uniref:type I restriction endonuclease subunit R n=1 Tax=Halorussus amylolyticus TaxID=1126242 RepID=UPI00104B31C2|nr:type I restriction endonuclease subunit R [Halorussus amylolyticus]
MADYEYDEVERPALDAFKRLGWDTIDQTREEWADPRDSLTNVILEDRLQSAIERLNPWINENNLHKAVRELRTLDAVDAMDANEQIHEKLVRYISLEQDLGHGKKHQTVKFIDFENPANNDFLVVNQFRVEGPTETIVPDLVAFVNGIPLGVIECKQSGPESREKAVTQLLRYQNQRSDIPTAREGAERLFWYNQFSIATAYEEAVAGTYGTPREEYKAWKDPYPADEADLRELFDTEYVSPQHTLLYSLFKPDRLLDILRHFTVFEEKTGGQSIKMVARYQQYRAVEKALDRIEKREADEANGGVVWHTQGSGKSLSMLFLGLKLRRLKPNPTLVLVTDRKALDRQIKGTFESCGFPNPKRAEGIADLREKLSHDAGETITTLIQKFQEHGEEELDEFPTLSESEDIYVMVDEAHRTQYKYLANNMRSALPNAFYVGFTGTPIEKDKRDTRQTFGNYIDTYTIDQSIEDGTTERILYQGRLADIHLDGTDLDAVFDRVFSDRSEEEKAEIKQRYAQEQDLAEAPRRIKTICLDLLDHFEEKIADPFTGMIVTTSRRAAITYKETLDDLHGPGSAVVISGDHNDPPELKRHTPSDEDLRDIKERFEDPDDDLRFLIVCDMLLTGYDAPIAQVMYLDKPLKEHSLLQAIARVNRPYEDKNYGLIVDYYGVSDNLQEALHQFSQKDVEKALTPLEDQRPKLEAAHQHAVSFFGHCDLDDREECVQALENEDTRIEFNRAFKQFSKMMDIVLPDPIANPYKEDHKRLAKIHAKAKERYRDEEMNLDGCGEKVREIIHDHITASDIEPLNEEPVSILDEEEFAAKLTDFDTEEAKASEMENALKHEIRVRFDEDPVFYESLKERVEKLIEQYRDKRLSEYERVEEYRRLIDEMRSRHELAREKGLNDATELSFYHALETVLTTEKDDQQWITTSEAELVELTEEIVSILQTRRVVDWKRKPNVQKEMRREVKLYLLKNHEVSADEIEAITTRVIELARYHFE